MPPLHATDYEGEPPEPNLKASVAWLIFQPGELSLMAWRVWRAKEEAHPGGAPLSRDNDLFYFYLHAPVLALTELSVRIVLPPWPSALIFTS
jgi:hypothetical protein